MRVLPLREKKKRGCRYCHEMKMINDHSNIRTNCPHDKCPYHVLDKYDTYEEFMASEDSKILVDGFFQTTASCYELSSGKIAIKKIYCDDCYNNFL